MPDEETSGSTPRAYDDRTFEEAEAMHIRLEQVVNEKAPPVARRRLLDLGRAA